MLKKKPTLTIEESAAIIERVNRGESVHKIARALDRHPSNIYGLLRRRYGISFPPKGARWSKTIKIPADPYVIGYIAGIIDGEGCISHRKDGHWMVRVQMTTPNVIDFLGDQVGGTLFDNDAVGKNRKPTKAWVIARSHDVQALLEATAPYLICKKEKALKCVQQLSRGEKLSTVVPKNKAASTTTPV